MIHSVAGPLPPDRLGHCQAHEHLFIRAGRPRAVHPPLWMDDLELTVRELGAYRAAGGRAVVDAQPVGCGRMAGYLAAASARSGVHVVAATGFHKTLYYPPGHWLLSSGEERLAELFAGELEEGMFEDGDAAFPAERTAARAGVIKTALEPPGLAGPYPALFGAAARAALRTGAPVLCHVEQGSDPLALVRFLGERGLPPERLILCHLDRSHPDPAFHLRVAAAGVWLEYDTIGRPRWHDDAAEIALLREVLAAGFEGRVLLALDTTRERLAAYGGAIGLDYLLTRFLPEARRGGISERSIERLMRENPARALSWRPSGRGGTP